MGEKKERNGRRASYYPVIWFSRSRFYCFWCIIGAFLLFELVLVFVRLLRCRRCCERRKGEINTDVPMKCPNPGKRRLYWCHVYCWLVLVVYMICLYGLAGLAFISFLAPVMVTWEWVLGLVRICSTHVIRRTTSNHSNKVASAVKNVHLGYWTPNTAWFAEWHHMTTSSGSLGRGSLWYQSNILSACAPKSLETLPWKLSHFASHSIAGRCRFYYWLTHTD